MKATDVFSFAQTHAHLMLDAAADLAAKGRAGIDVSYSEETLRMSEQGV